MFDELIKLANKFIPDKSNQDQFKIEAMKLEMEDFKNKKSVITRAFHLVFPCASLVLVCMYIVEFYLRVKQFLYVG